jgi:hypothetical protein
MIKQLIIPIMVMGIMLGGCQKKAEQEIVILPKDYKGYIVIIYDQKKGASARYEGKKRIYEIPPNGILKTQFTGNYGWREFAEFYYEGVSRENRLLSFAEFEKIPTDSLVGFIGPAGTVKKDANSDDRIEFVEFYVGTKLDIEQAQKQAERLGIKKLME